MEIIAEIGQNHNGVISLAKELIHAAKESGADVVKFQLYDAASVFSKKNNEWYDYNLKTELSYDELEELVAYAGKVEIAFMASAFDAERVSWLEKLGVLRHKLASRSIRDQVLIDALIETGKPIIASLGLWREPAFPKISAKEVSFLYCVCKYPTPLNDLNFSLVDFNEYDGFSDHTEGIEAATIAFAKGAKIIEKHFTLEKKMYGPDHAGSMTPDELKQLVTFKKNLHTCLYGDESTNESGKYVFSLDD